MRNVTLNMKLVDLLGYHSAPGINIILESDESYGGRWKFHNLSQEDPRFYNMTICEIAKYWGFEIPYRVVRGGAILLDVTN